MKKYFKVFTVMFICAVLLCGCKCNKEELEKLPLPEVTGGERGMLGIDKNINEASIDKYLNRSDSVYRDVRMLKDEGNYESIGGDSYLSGFVKGFEVVPYPYLAPLSGLPESVGKGYQGKTLFSVNENGEYVANYEESLEILEYLFPKDKNIFLMCGGGGYAGMTKQLLVSLGWDENKIWKTGGYWNYNGENNVEVKKEKDNTYAFWKVNYHNIDFSTLKEVK
jgi:rhodanese-related sulfurtransferase